MTGRRVIWQPNPGPQTRFLASSAKEVLYGGAAGGGKSAASVAMMLRWVHCPNYRGLFLRREAKYLSDAIDKSTALYPKVGGQLVQSPKIIWTFPSGAKIWLNHCEHEKDVANYDSLEFAEVIFEELTHFTEKQYRGIRARIRGTDPTLPYWSRATTNPGGPGHDWVFARFGVWLNPEHPRRARPGEVRHFRGDEEVPRGTEDSLSRQFIPALLTDNPHVTAGYRAMLLDLDPVRREQLLSGDWLVKPAAGLYFQRGNFEPITALPMERIVLARYWDRAATVNGDWTVGVKMAKMPNGIYVIVDVVRFRGPPVLVEANIKATAALDGKACVQVLEQDPGQAGVVEVDYLIKSLAGFNVRKVKPTGDKVTKAGPFSAQCAAGNVKILYPDGNAPAWVGPFFSELEGFPDGDYDDQVDAASGAFTYLTAKRASTGSGDAHAYGDDRRSMDGFVLSRPC